MLLKESADYRRTANLARDVLGTLSEDEKGRRETFVPRRHTRSHRLPVACYLLQHPEPQHPPCSAFTAAGRHSSTQQTQVHFVHSQLPVSQHRQHSHFAQPTFWLLLVAGTKGTRASAARRIRLFMVGILCMGTMNRSLHVTTCERGKAIARVQASRRGSSPRTSDTVQRPIQFRQTP